MKRCTVDRESSVSRCPGAFCWLMLLLLLR